MRQENYNGAQEKETMALEKASVVKAKGLLRADEVRSEIERKKRERQ
jgi:hypothetical protein